MRGYGTFGCCLADDAARVPGRTFALGTAPCECYELRARVVPLESLVTSHTDSLAPNPDFPRELQPRERGRVASRVQIDSIANRLDADQLLIDSHAIDRGSPIIGPDGIVESGNGRTLALRQVAKNDPEKYAEYVAALRERLGDYGLEDDVLEGIEHPVLVRERVTDVDRPSFAASANRSASAEMSPLERARADAGRIPDAAVQGMSVQEGQTIDEALTAPANRGLQRAFVGSLSETERGGALLYASGNLNAAGLERLKNARCWCARTPEVLGSGWRRPSRAEHRPRRQERRGRRWTQARPPSLARRRRWPPGRATRACRWRGDIATAVDVYARLRRAGLGVGDYLAQAPLFGARETTPLHTRARLPGCQHPVAPAYPRAAGAVCRRGGPGRRRPTRRTCSARRCRAHRKTRC